MVQKRLVPLVLALPKADRLQRASIIVSVAPALHLGAAGTANAVLTDLPELARDEALGRIARVILTKLLWSEPYELRPGTGYDITFEEANTVISLMRQMTCDWRIYYLIEALVDSAVLSAYRDNFKRPQRAELIRQLEELADHKFPSPKYIKHQGYVVAARAQINRMKDPTDASPSSELASAARAIPNLADRAYVIAIVAATSRKAAERQRYLAEARKIVDGIPILADRIDRYDMMSQMLIDIDPGASKELLRQALQLSLTGEGESIEARRQSLIDLAYRVYPDSAASLASTSDDDPAKAKIEKQLRLYRLRDVLALKRPPANAPVARNAFELSRVAWMKLASLNGQRTAAVPPARALPALEYAAPQEISRAYPIFAWFIENAVRYMKGVDAVRSYVLPLFEACLRGAELAIRTSTRTVPHAQRLLEFGKPGTDQQQGIAVQDNERQEGLRFLREWLSAQTGKALWIVEPYFHPADVELLALIGQVADDFSVTVVSSKRDSLKGVTPPYEDAYRAAWDRLSSDEPPSTTLIFVESRQSGKFPVHDRWWLSDNSGLHLGTSYSGIGAKLSEIRTLTSEETRNELLRLKPYFTQTRLEFEGERLSYASFTL